MSEENYMVTVESDGVETIMAVCDDLFHAAQCADMLRRDGYEAVNVKKFNEVV